MSDFSKGQVVRCVATDRHSGLKIGNDYTVKNAYQMITVTDDNGNDWSHFAENFVPIDNLSKDEITGLGLQIKIKDALHLLTLGGLGGVTNSQADFDNAIAILNDVHAKLSKE